MEVRNEKFLVLEKKREVISLNYSWRDMVEMAGCWKWVSSPES